MTAKPPMLESSRGWERTESEEEEQKAQPTADLNGPPTPGTRPTAEPKAPPQRKAAGQIIERGKNNYLLRIFLGRDGATGRRRYLNEKFHGNKKQAQTRLTKFLGDRDVGTLVEPTKSTLGEYLDHWLRVAVKPNVQLAHATRPHRRRLWASVASTRSALSKSSISIPR